MTQQGFDPKPQPTIVTIVPTKEAHQFCSRHPLWHEYEASQVADAIRNRLGTFSMPSILTVDGTPPDLK